jgi:hypothetical protein
MRRWGLSRRLSADKRRIDAFAVTGVTPVTDVTEVTEVTDVTV